MKQKEERPGRRSSFPQPTRRMIEFEKTATIRDPAHFSFVIVIAPTRS